jgi:hypothetical protein
MQADQVFKLALRLAQIADEHPRHVAIDAIDIAGVLMRSGRDYSLLEAVIQSGPQQSLPGSQESSVAA